jgi:hypothetical protein
LELPCSGAGRPPLAAQADLIVSGDAHLPDLKSFLGISISNAAEVVARL